MSVRTTRRGGTAVANKNAVPLHCAHCRKSISGQESHKFLTDLLTAPNNDDSDLIKNSEVSVLDALARVVGIRLLATYRIVTSNQLCICESCHRLLQSLFQAYDSFCNKNSYIVINPGWKNEPCVPILMDNSTQADFTEDSNSQSVTVAYNDEIQIVDLDVDLLDDDAPISPECEPGSFPDSSTPVGNSTLSETNNAIPTVVDVQLSEMAASATETTVHSKLRGQRMSPSCCKKSTSLGTDNHDGLRLPFVRIEPSFRRLADLKIKESAKPDNNAEFFNRWYDSMSLPALNAKLTLHNNVFTSATPSTDEAAVIPPPNQAEPEPKTPSHTELQGNIVSAMGPAQKTASCELLALNEKIGIGIRILRSKARVNYKELVDDNDGAADTDDDENEKVKPKRKRATRAKDEEDLLPPPTNGQDIKISQDIFEDPGSDIESTSSSESDTDGEGGLRGSNVGATAEVAKPIGIQCDYPDCSYSYLLFALRSLFDHQLQVHGQLTQGALEAAEKCKTKIKQAKEQRKKPSVCKARNCNRRFRTHEGLARHSICHLPGPERRKAYAKFSKIGPKKFMCNVKDCWKEFHSSTALSSHRKKYHSVKESRSDGKDVMSMEKCENSGTTKDEINQASLEDSDPNLGEEHNTDEVELEEVPCAYPDCSSSNLRFTLIGLARHQIKVHGQVTKSAVEASDKLKKRMAQLREQRIRNKRRRFICEAEGCGRSFSRRSHLDNHGIVHLPVEQKREARTRLKLKEKLFKCDAEDCLEKFGGLKALSAHKMIFHPTTVTQSGSKKAKSKPKTFKCSSHGCEKSFRIRYDLGIHEQTHLPPERRKRRFACTICKERFQTCTKRNSHLIQIHSQARNHLCTECGKSYKNSVSLNSHMISHANKRAYKCQECGATFNKSTPLKNHMLFVHSSQRLITCEICGKTFKSKINLSFHMVAHKNERTHKCPAPGCTAAFNYKHHLMQHLTGSGNHGLDKDDVNRYLKNPESIQLFKQF